MAQRKGRGVPICSVVIPAAGSSSRMEGIDKILEPLGELPVLVRTLQVFQSCDLVHEVIVVTREDLIVPVSQLCRDFMLDKVTKVMVGGAERVLSVRIGVQEARRDAALIAIHDGARPLLSREVLEEVLKKAAVTGAAAPAIPMVDTIKRAERGVVVETMDRSSLWAVQTPQVFEASLIRAALEKAVADGETVIAITISGRLSGTYQSATIAAEDFAGKVFVIDSYNATIGEGILVKYALLLKDQGLSAKEIVGILEASKEQIHTLGVLDTLEYLKKGGRISAATAFLGGAMAIKPVVAVSEGEIIMLGKARGSKNGNNFLMKEIEKADGIDFTRPFCLGYTGLSDEMLQKYIKDSEALWSGHTDQLPVCSLGATIGTHVGPGAIAVAFFSPQS